MNKKTPNTALINININLDSHPFTLPFSCWWKLTMASSSMSVWVFLLPHWDSATYILFDPLKVEVNVIPICHGWRWMEDALNFFSKMQIWMFFMIFFFQVPLPEPFAGVKCVGRCLHPVPVLVFFHNSLRHGGECFRFVV